MIYSDDEKEELILNYIESPESELNETELDNILDNDTISNKSNSSNDSDGSNESVSNCPICLELVTEDRLTTPCEHKFHKQCIQNYMNQSNIRRYCICPICRRRLDMKDLLNLDINEDNNEGEIEISIAELNLRINYMRSFRNISWILGVIQLLSYIIPELIYEDLKNIKFYNKNYKYYFIGIINIIIHIIWIVQSYKFINYLDIRRIEYERLSNIKTKFKNLGLTIIVNAVSQLYYYFSFTEYYNSITDKETFEDCKTFYQQKYWLLISNFGSYIMIFITLFYFIDNKRFDIFFFNITNERRQLLEA